MQLILMLTAAALQVPGPEKNDTAVQLVSSKTSAGLATHDGELWSAIMPCTRESGACIWPK